MNGNEIIDFNSVTTENDALGINLKLKSTAGGVESKMILSSGTLSLYNGCDEIKFQTSGSAGNIINLEDQPIHIKTNNTSTRMTIDDSVSVETDLYVRDGLTQGTRLYTTKNASDNYKIFIAPIRLHRAIIINCANLIGSTKE